MQSEKSGGESTAVGHLFRNKKNKTKQKITGVANNSAIEKRNNKERMALTRLG